MISVEKALELIKSNISTSDNSEVVDIFNCSGRILFNDIVASFNVPPINNSSMDGYALISGDLTNASLEKPVSLKVIGESRTGTPYIGGIVIQGCAVRIMTGASLPPGADCVVPFEDTVEADDYVQVFKKVSVNENIRFAGENLKKGSLVLKKGTYIDSAEIGIISSANFHTVAVYKKPKVAIISTGDELAEPGTIYSDNIINSNAYVIYSEVKKYGCDPYYEGIVRDDFNEIKNLLLRLTAYDVIISTGGVSMGKYDYIHDVYREIGINIIIDKVNMRPGKPVIFGKKDDKIFFGLPGNPVSSMVSLIQFVRPALLIKSGCLKIEKPKLKALLKEDIAKVYDRKYFIRGIFHFENGIPSVFTTGPQGSGNLTSMSNANCLIVLPSNTDFIKRGEYVDIELIHHREI